MLKFRKVSYILCLLLVFFTLTACQNSSEQVSSEGVRFIITKSFGYEVIKDEVVPFNENYAVLDYLEAISEVETAYGGGFVNGIDGLKSGFTDSKDKVKKDWFFYANGIFSHMGALDYYPLAGDVIQWDYHEWENSSNSNAVLTGWPSVFISGYDGLKAETSIVYTETYKDAAEGLRKALKETGVDASITAHSLEMDLGEGGHTILLADYLTLLEDTLTSKILETYKNRGLYIGLEESNIVAFTQDYSASEIIDDEVVMFAYQKIYAQPDTLFVVAGDDAGLIEQFLEMIMSENEVTMGKSGLLLNSNGLNALPLSSEPLVTE